MGEKCIKRVQGITARATNWPKTEMRSGRKYFQRDKKGGEG